jgi:hypothetical protein
MVTSGSFCSSDPHPAGFAQVLSFSPPGPGTSTPQSGVQRTITIDPSAMPAGAELSFGYFQLASGQLAGEQEAEVVLVDTSSYTCTSTPPDLNGPGAALRRPVRVVTSRGPPRLVPAPGRRSRPGAFRVTPRYAPHSDGPG